MRSLIALKIPLPGAPDLSMSRACVAIEVGTLDPGESFSEGGHLYGAEKVIDEFELATAADGAEVNDGLAHGFEHRSHSIERGSVRFRRGR